MAESVSEQARRASRSRARLRGGRPTATKCCPECKTEFTARGLRAHINALREHIRAAVKVDVKAEAK